MKNSESTEDLLFGKMLSDSVLSYTGLCQFIQRQPPGHTLELAVCRRISGHLSNPRAARTKARETAKQHPPPATSNRKAKIQSDFKARLIWAIKL